MFEELIKKIKQFDTLALMLPVDPVSKKRSVTLLLVVISFIAILIFSGLEAYGQVKTTSEFLNVFLASLATYVGRRFSNGKSSVEDDKKE